MIRIVVVEDSPSVRTLLIAIIESDPEMKVIGTAVNGEEAIDCVARLSPDVVTMDIIMPKLSGIEAIKEIMNRCPVPIIVVSATYDNQAVSSSFEAMEAGAVAAVPKPVPPTSPDFLDYQRSILKTIRLMSEVRVVRRRCISDTAESDRSRSVHQANKCRIVAIGASTGGPPVIENILSLLTVPPPFPILIVQHISQGFISGMASWLQKRTNRMTVVASDGDQCRAGTVYIAPDGYHMGIRPDGRIQLSQKPPRRSLRPSVGYLFDSVTASYGSASLGIILTGMGDDGASELLNLYNAGGDTVAQDEDSAVVYGMPGRAIECGGVRHILSPACIAGYIDRKSTETMADDGGASR